MKSLFFTVAVSSITSSFITSVTAQRPSNTSICDYYTTALLTNNTGSNQQTLLTLLVNTVVIGNYTKPNVGIVVPGILAPGNVNGTQVNLLPFFDGSLASSNRGGSNGVSVNFLDDGGAMALLDNKPANGTTSNQFKLIIHLYQFFGALLGCSATDFPAYEGQVSMYQVHKFMNLDVCQVTYFIQQVGLAAASFGVADADIGVVAEALNSLFGQKCSPPTTVIPSQRAELQAICVADNCPLAANSTCAAYAAATSPARVNGTSTGGPTGSGNSSVSMPGTAPTKTATGSAMRIEMGDLALTGAMMVLFTVLLEGRLA